MELITKKQQLKNAIKDKDWKKALSIAKIFRIEFKPEQQRIIQIANECYDNPSRTNSYKGMGVDVKENQDKAIKLLKQYK